MPYLDQLMERLKEFKLANAFPDVFKPLFVATDKCAPQDVINILRPKTAMTDSEQCVYQHLRRFLVGCNQSGEVFFVTALHQSTLRAQWSTVSLPCQVLVLILALGLAKFYEMTVPSYLQCAYTSVSHVCI